MFKKLWDWLKRPSSLAWSVVFLFGVVVAIGGWGVAHSALKATGSTEFCVSCHEMQTPYAEYQKTVHYQNRTGVRAGCSNCHVPESGLPYLVAKVRASKDLYHHFLGTLATPEDFEEHRLEMAQTVWARMKETDSRECRSCHAFDAMTIDDQEDEAQRRHTEAMQNGDTCIDCHKGIAHTLPDMKKAFARAFEDLKASAADADLEDKAYTLETLPFFLEKDGDRPAGKLLPATELTITEQSGGWLAATVSGWRQEGAESVIYGAPGQRILTAVMAKSTVEHADVGEGKVLPETGQTWMPVSLDIWLPKESVTASIDPVWSYAESIYQGDCATCHTAHAANHFLANQWIGQLKAMERFSQLSKEQNRLVLKFLQYHAKDMTQTADAGH